MTKKIIRKPATKPKRKSRSLAQGTCSAIPFTNKEGHVMRLSGSMTLRELIKMGVVEIHMAKPGTPLRLQAQNHALLEAGGLMRAWIGDNEKTITERWDALMPNIQVSRGAQPTPDSKHP